MGSVINLHRSPPGGCNCPPDILAQARNARLAMVWSSTPVPLDDATTSPAELGPPLEPGHVASDEDLEAAFERQRYGYTGAPRMPRRPLPGALGRAAEAKASRPMPLPDLLLAKGAMTAHPAPTWMQRLRRAWLAWRLKRMVPRLR